MVIYHKFILYTRKDLSLHKHNQYNKLTIFFKGTQRNHNLKEGTDQDGGVKRF